MPVVQRITPCLWFDQQAEEAAKFYTGIFRNSRITKTAYYGEAGHDIHGMAAGTVLTVAFELDGQAFTAKLHHLDGNKPIIPTGELARAIVNDVATRSTFDVTDIKRRERRKNPAEPFKTSTLQQEAAKKLGFGSKRTMRLAQNLYEGIELGKAEGAVGLITYMRTDSTRISETAVAAAREYLRTQYPDAFLAKAPMLYGAAGDTNAQDAHEGIRPTDPVRTPDSVQKYLSPEQFKLYQLIWQRFMASQMPRWRPCTRMASAA